MKIFIVIVIEITIVFITGCSSKSQNIQKEYYESGALKVESEIKNGVPHGLTKVYYENGQIEREVIFKNGLMNDSIIYYYPNGNFKEISETKDGEKHGSYKEYYAEGMLKRVGKVNNGMAYNYWKLFSTTGLKYEVNITDQLEGIVKYTGNGMQFYNFKDHYSISLPSKWIHARSEDGHIKFINQSVSSNDAICSITLSTNVFQDDFILEELVRKSLQDMESTINMNNIKVDYISEKKHEVFFNANYDGLDLTSIQKFYKDNKSCHLVTFIASKSIYDQFEELFNQQVIEIQPHITLVEIANGDSLLLDHLKLDVKK